MNGWTKYNLKKLTSKIGSGATPRGGGNVYKSEGISLIRSQNVLDLSFSIDGLAFIDDLQADQLSSVVVHEDDILLNITGDSVARVCKVPSNVLPARVNQHVSIVRTKTEVADVNFLLYYLQFIKPHLLSISEIGGTRRALTKGMLEDLDISLPPLPEQKSIASILSSLDDKIDLLHRQNATLEAMAETLFRQWFVEEAKEEWEEVKVGDFVRINELSIDKSYPNEVIKYLDTGSLTEGRVDSLQLLSLTEAPSRAKRIVRHNDVLISTVRPNQKHFGIIKNPPVNLIASTGFCVLSCDLIDPHFIYLLLTTDEITEYLHSIAEGSTSTYPSLKPSDLASLRFPLPPQQKLKPFSNLAKEVWAKIELNQKSIDTLTALRDTLLPKLMSGEVRVEE